jgi:hypothetical protein
MIRLRKCAAIWQICSHPRRSSEPTCLRLNLNGCLLIVCLRSTIAQANGHFKKRVSISFTCVHCTAAFEIGPPFTARCTSTFTPPTKRALASLSYRRHLKPGGWYEQVEYAVRWSADDGTIPKGHVFERWGDVFEEAGEKMGKTFKILDQQKQFLLDHGGFQNVTERRYKMPVGPWSSDRKYKEVGRWHLLECSEGVEGWSMALLTRLMGVSNQKTYLLYSDEHTLTAPLQL